MTDNEREVIRMMLPVFSREEKSRLDHKQSLQYKVPKLPFQTVIMYVPARTPVFQ